MPKKYSLKRKNYHVIIMEVQQVCYLTLVYSIDLQYRPAVYGWFEFRSARLSCWWRKCQVCCVLCDYQDSSSGLCCQSPQGDEKPGQSSNRKHLKNRLLSFWPISAHEYEQKGSWEIDVRSGWSQCIYEHVCTAQTLLQMHTRKEIHTSQIAVKRLMY